MPCVSLGEPVERGDVLAGGPSTDLGELALGQNLCAWRSCRGTAQLRALHPRFERVVREGRNTTITFRNWRACPVTQAGAEGSPLISRTRG